MSVDGANEEALYNCGAAMQKKGSKDEAIQMFNSYLQQYPSGKYVNDANKAIADLQK